MDKMRILVVDDSVVIRKLLQDTLAKDADLEVVGTASNGRFALEKIAALKPDLVTLDIEMPEVDGLQVLAELRKTDRRTRVIMFSSLTERGARATLDALALGADDYLAKPSISGPEEGQSFVSHELLPKIKAFARRPSRNALAAAQAPTAVTAGLKSTAASPPPKVTALHRADLVIVAISTGGPPAITEVLAALPSDLPVPVLIVQHMPAMFTRLLAERIASKSKIAVVEAKDGERVKAGTAYFAPGDFHMSIKPDAGGHVIVLNQAPPENSVRPAADVLFRAAADLFGARCLGVVMTGMGEDGLRGARRVRQMGGKVLAQDEATSVVWGMPGAVVHAGLADKVLPLGGLAGEILARVMHNRIPAHRS